MNIEGILQLYNVSEDFSKKTNKNFNCSQLRPVFFSKARDRPLPLIEGSDLHLW